MYVNTLFSTLTFAARRNVPIKYNRDTVAATLKAMPRIEEIRRRRERVFYKRRMAGNKEAQKAADRKLVEENSHLLPVMRASERKAMQQAAVKENGEELEEMTEIPRISNKVFGRINERKKQLVEVSEEDEEDEGEDESEGSEDSDEEMED